MLTLVVPRSRLALVSFLALAVVVTALAMPAEAAPRGRYAVGDSVMLGAKPNLENRGYRVDARLSRQVSDGLTLLRAKARNDSLRNIVVVHLGTNGTFSKSQCRAMHSTVGKKRHLFLVTVKVPRSWERGNNRVIRRCSARYGNTHLIDWHDYVRRHPGLVESDGYHLTSKGARHYAELVSRRVTSVRG